MLKEQIWKAVWREPAERRKMLRAKFDPLPLLFAILACAMVRYGAPVAAQTLSPGRIAVGCLASGAAHFNVCLMDADGSNITQLTNFSAGLCNVAFPAWSAVSDCSSALKAEASHFLGRGERYARLTQASMGRDGQSSRL